MRAEINHIVNGLIAGKIFRQRCRGFRAAPILDEIETLKRRETIGLRPATRLAFERPSDSSALPLPAKIQDRQHHRDKQNGVVDRQGGIDRRFFRREGSAMAVCARLDRGNQRIMGKQLVYSGQWPGRCEQRGVGIRNGPSVGKTFPKAPLRIPQAQHGPK